MGKLADLNGVQTKTLTDFDTQLRQAIQGVIAAVNQAQACQNQYAATVVPVLGLLDGTETLPVGALPFSGAVPLDKGDPGYLISYLHTITDLYHTQLSDADHMNLYVKSVGAANCL